MFNKSTVAGGQLLHPSCGVPYVLTTSDVVHCDTQSVCGEGIVNSCGPTARMANFAKGLSKLKLKEAPGYVQEYAGEQSISWHLQRAGPGFLDVPQGLTMGAILPHCMG